MSDTCSAYPERLKTCGNVGQRDDRDLSVTARRLSSALDALARSKPDPTVLAPFDDWGGDLQRYASRKTQIDQWVVGVGVAFEKAGGVTDAGPGELWIATDAGTLDRILAQADPRAKQALDLVQLMLGDSLFNGDGALIVALAQVLKGLTPEQLQAFLWALSPDDMKWIGVQLLPLPMGMGANNDDRNALLNVVLASADPDLLKRLMQYMPELEPLLTNLRDTYKGFSWDWRSPGGTLWGPSGGPDPLTDINQGADGDCWYLAGLGAVALTNPDLLRRNIRQNPNGTFTVTFYRDGRPVDITVTNDFAYGSKPGWYAWGYAHEGSDSAEWAMIYEKAYAEFRGGYPQIDGGFGDTSLADLSGRKASRGSPGDYSLADVKGRLDQGYAITAGTNRNDSPWWDFWDHPDRIDNKQLVTSHEYYVKSVDLSGHPPTITVVNPWGSGGGAPQLVTLTESEFHRYFDEISLAQVGP
jgi:Calpain family cysteine protease